MQELYAKILDYKYCNKNKCYIIINLHILIIKITVLKTIKILIIIKKGQRKINISTR